MYWEIFVVIVALWLIRGAWRTYTHPASVLGRQAANMNWVAAGRVEDDKGFKNVKYTRAGVEAVVSFVDHNVILVRPKHTGRFSDFVELERWLAGHADSAETDINSCENGPRIPEPRSIEDIEISNFHPALDAAVEWTINSLIADGLTDKGRSDRQLAITAEMMVFTASCLAKLKGSTDIDRTVWNTFKSGVENRILEYVEEQPPTGDVIETSHSTIYVSLTTEYYAMLDDIEEALKSSRQTVIGNMPVKLLHSFGEQLGSAGNMKSSDLEVVIMKLQEFARQQILPRVARIF